MKKKRLIFLLASVCVAGLLLSGCQKQETELTEEEIYWNEISEIMENYDENMVSYTMDVDFDLPYAKARKIENTSDFRKGLTIHLVRMELTPWTLTLFGECDYDPATEKLDGINFRIEKITYEDGTVIEAIDHTSGDEESPAYDYNALMMDVNDNNPNEILGENDIRNIFGEKVEIENVKSITIDGVEIMLSE